MQKTETYQFNLIEGSDPFSQEPINENTKAMEAILAQLPRVQSGSYVGTGTVGEEHPNSLTFDFVPKVVIFDLDSSTYAALPYAWGSSHLPVLSNSLFAPDGSAGLYGYNVVTVKGTTMTWYADNFIQGGEGVQLNFSGKTYRYVAIG